MTGIAQDLRYAVRGLFKAPGFALVAILTLAVAVGANTTIFTLISVLTLRSLPVEQPEQLVGIDAVDPEGTQRGLSMAALRELQRRQRSFSDLIGWDGNGVVSVETDGGLTLANFWAATGNFHSALGETPHLGRVLSVGDEETNAPVVVLGYHFWERRLGARPDVLGETIRIEGLPFTIVGVTTQTFTGLWVGGAPDVTVPISARAGIFRGTGDVRPNDVFIATQVAGRLRAGTTVDQARAEIQSLWSSLRETTAPPALSGARRDAFLAATPAVESISTGYERFLRPRFTRPLYLLMGIAGVMLLIACVHLASLQLARAVRRAGELSVRVALGASSRRLVAQSLTESFILSLCGALVGLALAAWSSHLLANFMTQQFLSVPTFDFRPDPAVIGVTLAAMLLAAVLSGTAPAWFAARRDPIEALRRTSRRLPSVTGGRPLIVVQVALTMVLLAGAGLLAGSVGNAHDVDAGFRPDGLLQVQLFRRPGVPVVDPPDYRRQMVERVIGAGGVQAASLSSDRTGRANSPQESVSSRGDRATASLVSISPGHFEVIGLPLISGRDFRWNDADEDGSRVAILSRALSQQLFPAGDAVGQIVQYGAPAAVERLVVGVVGDARLEDVRKDSGLFMYTPLVRQRQASYLHVRTSADSGALRAEVARQVERLGRQFVFRTNTTTEIIDQSLVELRLTRLVAQFFAGVSLALVCIGLYGVMSYRTAARTPEIGIRMALGAHPRTVLRSSLKDAVVLILAGIGAGVPIALVSTTALRSLLFGLEPNDPLTLLAAMTVLVGCGALAAYLPARRAACVDPLVALKYE